MMGDELSQLTGRYPGLYFWLQVSVPESSIYMSIHICIYTVIGSISRSRATQRQMYTLS
ncbi:hypothetical protein P175DRAFT_0500422 [Aspergillus ochraceoroseus IBT 24754]|uniref:Uncharacterized protein n=1 Tax=Aspergillus ochraceoroseus IBT 24754 TaxID=1392256 RepID=A0A2T5LZ14_9EURO|nr:uncharacterized protein P175DRAFT_0500422 [Aspergillus ochraceoroseus IBT 24754]PTU21530.1 hypothetical protein P175DRAFT_0500422 [Aspergillus ochraceoroseus IBT 24754]